MEAEGKEKEINKKNEEIKVLKKVHENEKSDLENGFQTQKNELEKQIKSLKNKLKKTKQIEAKITKLKDKHQAKDKQDRQLAGKLTSTEKKLVLTEIKF